MVKTLELYEKRVQEVIDQHGATAKDVVPELYGILRQILKDPKEARKKLHKDLDPIWNPDYIDQFLPDEAKDTHAQEVGRKGGRPKGSKKNAPMVIKNNLPPGVYRITLNNDGSQNVEPVNIEEKPEPVSEPYSAGAKKDRTATYTERQTTLIQELQAKLSSALKEIAELKARKPNAYNDDVTQELLDAQIKIKKLEAPFDYSLKIDIGIHRVPVKVHVRPALKEVASVIIQEEDIPAGAFTS